jgi:hypothetical protein
MLWTCLSVIVAHPWSRYNFCTQSQSSIHWYFRSCTSEVYFFIWIMAYRSAEHDTTKYSPNRMIFGRDVRQPVDLLYGTVSNTENFDNLSDYVHNIRTVLHLRSIFLYLKNLLRTFYNSALYKLFHWFKNYIPNEIINLKKIHIN